jgi:putative tryptophan/tyrosine transport system ATP-binding protein
MIILEGIVKRFGAHTVINKLSCTISKGESIVIVGANGSGKTTLFELIAGTILPDAGKIIINGTDYTKTGAAQRVPCISRLFQSTEKNIVPTMTVAENIALALYKGRRACLQNGMYAFKTNPIVMETLEQFNLISLRTKSMTDLSGGQQQLVAFVMAIIIPPAILLLDEPTAALDPYAAVQLLAAAKQYIRHHEITTLLITHDKEVATTFSSIVWIMKEGILHKVA